MKNKWFYIAGGIFLLIALVLIWKFAPEIQRWLAGVFINLLLLVVAFVAGWCFGRFGKSQKKEK